VPVWQPKPGRCGPLLADDSRPTGNTRGQLEWRSHSDLHQVALHYVVNRPPVHTWSAVPQPSSAAVAQDVGCMQVYLFLRY